MHGLVFLPPSPVNMSSTSRVWVIEGVNPGGKIIKQYVVGPGEQALEMMRKLHTNGCLRKLWLKEVESDDKEAVEAFRKAFQVKSDAD